MWLNTIGSIAIAAFCFVAATIVFLLFVFVAFTEPLEGRGIGVLLLIAIIFAVMGYRALRGTWHAE